MPAYRRIALRIHLSPNRRSSDPTKTWKACSGMTLISVTPNTPTSAPRVSNAAPAPYSGARQPRVTPMARTIVYASTNSTTDPMNAGTAAMTIVSICNTCYVVLNAL